MGMIAGIARLLNQLYEPRIANGFDTGMCALRECKLARPAKDGRPLSVVVAS